jgi:hypothetical protein
MLFAKELTVSTNKNGNKGKKFYTCSNDRACNYFEWAEAWRTKLFNEKLKLEADAASGEVLTIRKQKGKFSSPAKNRETPIVSDSYRMNKPPPSLKDVEPLLANAVSYCFEVSLAHLILFPCVRFASSLLFPTDLQINLHNNLFLAPLPSLLFQFRLNLSFRLIVSPHPIPTSPPQSMSTEFSWSRVYFSPELNSDVCLTVTTEYVPGSICETRLGFVTPLLKDEGKACMFSVKVRIAGCARGT